MSGVSDENQVLVAAAKGSGLLRFDFPAIFQEIREDCLDNVAVQLLDVTGFKVRDPDIHWPGEKDQHGQGGQQGGSEDKDR